MNSIDNRIFCSDKLKSYDCFALIGPIDPRPSWTQSIQCCVLIDGGINFSSDIPLSIPTYSLGDGDSAIDSARLNFKLEQEKDFSDLAFALSCLPKKTKKIFCFGFSGKRTDHFLINIGELYNFVYKGATKCIVELDKNILIIPKGTITLQLSGEFSISSLVTSTFSIFGQCKYQVKQAIELSPLSSRGLSNIGSGKITIKTNVPIIIFLSHQQENYEISIN